MVYVDTSVLIALIIHEQRSKEVISWYEDCKEELVAAVWCVTEFSSALGIKQRTKQISETQANRAWNAFEKLCSNDLNLLALDSKTYFKAAELSLQYETGLRAGDSLHLASALACESKKMATLDEVLAQNARTHKLKMVI
jgi:uncharacterized protein